MTNQDIDLTTAVDVAARAAWDREVKRHGDEFSDSYDDLGPLIKQSLRQATLEWIYPVAQMLFDQGKRAMLTELRDIDAVEQWYFDE